MCHKIIIREWSSENQTEQTVNDDNKRKHKQHEKKQDVFYRKSKSIANVIEKRTIRYKRQHTKKHTKITYRCIYHMIVDSFTSNIYHLAQSEIEKCGDRQPITLNIWIYLSKSVSIVCLWYIARARSLLRRCTHLLYGSICTEFAM